MSMDPPNWNQGAEPPPAKKSGSKTWLILGVILGISVLVCCGGGVVVIGYFGSQVANMMSNDPIEVKKSQAEIVDIAIPADIPAKFRLDLDIVGQEVALLVYFGATGDDNLVWLAEAGKALVTDAQGDQDKLRSGLETQLVAQAAAAQTGTFKTLSQTTQREVDVTVNGKDSKITLTEGVDGAGKKIVQAVGMFEGKTGPTLIKLQVEADKHSADEVEAMLKSMK